MTYNKAKPNRQARRLGIKPEEQKREEKDGKQGNGIKSKSETGKRSTKKNHTAGNDIRRIYGIPKR